MEVFDAALAADGPPPAEVRLLCSRAAARMGVLEGHVAVQYVSEERIAALNAAHRGKASPTDVLSFPIDGAEPHAPHAAGAPAGAETLPRELGDIVICPQHTADLREAVVHGMLHLLGLDHETDDGEMLALQEELLAEAQP